MTRPLALLLALFPPLALAHRGGLNADGCHNNRKTGDYHCHGAAKRASPPPSMPASGFAPSYAAPGQAFRNCTEARNAGAAPVRRSDPGYGSHLDRDGDGVGCE
jgi:hypothetical protein